MLKTTALESELAEANRKIAALESSLRNAASVDLRRVDSDGNKRSALQPQSEGGLLHFCDL